MTRCVPAVTTLMRRLFLAAIIAVLSMSLPSEARAQGECPPEALDCANDELPPVIFMRPPSRTIASAAPLAVEVDWCDQLGLNLDSRILRWRGQTPAPGVFSLGDFPPGENIPANCNQRARESGTATPAPGSNVLYAYVCDYAGHCVANQTSYEYDITAVRDRRGVIQKGAGTQFTERFWIRNIGAEQYSYVLRTQCTNATSCTPSPSSITLAAGESAYVNVSYVTGAANARAGVTLLMKYAADTTVYDAGGLTVDVLPPTYGVEVRPQSGYAPATASTAASVPFIVRNYGNAQATYTLTSSCAGCSPSVGTVAVRPGDSATVNVNFTAGALNTFKTVDLRAVSGTARDSGAYSVRAQAAKRPHVVLDSLELGTALERSECLNVSLVGDVAYECADLRIVHPLPVVRTLGKARAPVLHYNSLHAGAQPLVGAIVTHPGTTTLLTSVKARLFSGATTYDSLTWSGSQFPIGSRRRIALALKNASVGASGVYPFSLEVVFDYSGSKFADTVTGTMAIVDRSQSAFGAGWWLAGLEQLVKLQGSDSLMLWIGGDGSTRRYVKRAGATIWIADRVDRPDSLGKVGTEYRRYLPHGATVRFDASGRHVSTVDRLGRTTRFAYSGTNTYPDSLVLPSGTSRMAYAFGYVSGLLRTVTLPGIDNLHSVNITPDAQRRVTSIRDFDSTSVGFEYPTATSPYITARTDRRLTRTSFDYGAGNKVERSTIYMQEGAGRDIITNFRPQENRGAGGSTPASVYDYTLLDGPRSVADTTMFWLTRFGGVRRIKDALGVETSIYREHSRYPALVTRVRTPRGYQTAAVFDTLARLVTTVDSGTYVTAAGGARTYAQSSYQWHPTWEFATMVVGADTRDTTRFGFDASGNRIWQRNAVGDSVKFGYDGLGRVSSVRTVRITADGSLLGDSIAYDAQRGNVAETFAPRRVGSVRAYQDAFGRDTLVVSPITASLNDTTRITYDAEGRVILTRQSAPPVPYFYRVNSQDRSGTAPAMAMWAKNEYDEEGNLKAVKRGSIPDINALDTIVTRYTYDRANRQTAETRADGSTAKSVTYDLAGNVVAGSGSNRSWSAQYDLLGRMVRRDVAGSIGDECETDIRFPTPYFPRHDVLIVDGQCIGFQDSADVQRFVYDSLGRLLEATNRDALVYRSYAENGALVEDSLLVRTLASTDSGGTFYSRPFVVRHGYDIAGRLASTDGTTYDYDPAGRLWKVRTPGNETFRWVYNKDGQIDSLSYPTGVLQKRDYDLDGRMTRRREWLGTNVFHDDVLTYDERGKILTAATVAEEAGNAYSGLGHLIRSSRATIPLGYETSDERFLVDGLGYRHTKSVGPTPADSQVYFYQARLGRHITSGYAPGTASSSPMVVDSTEYNAAGDRIVYRQNWSSVSKWETATYYYDGLGMLRAADVRRCRNPNSDVCMIVGGGIGDPRSSGVFENYRYDALGRRVMVRSRKDNICVASEDICSSTVTWTFWDGDEVAKEIREADPQHPQPQYSDQLGTVTYVNGPTIDLPLQVTREGYSRVIPYVNWRGLPDQGSYGACHDFQQPSGSSCGTVEWPAGRQEIFFTRKATRFPTPTVWWGNVIQNGEDQTGQLYRRNRYYDPTSGKFTQEDPIGIAGGLNTYGYANGDPISFRDPLGLCPGWFGALTGGYQADCDYDLDGVNTPPEVAAYKVTQSTGAARIFWNALGMISQTLREPGAAEALGAIGGSIRVKPGAIQAPPLGRNGVAGAGSNPRVNTDLPGGRAVAKSIFRHVTKGQEISQEALQNGGVRRTAADGTQIRMNQNGTTRLDLPNRGPAGETIHFNP